MHIKRAMLVMAGAAALLAAASGCGPSLPDQIVYSGQAATLQSGVNVTFQDIFTEEEIFKVKLFIQNGTQAFLNIDRNGFALRLPDGRVLPRAIGTFTTHHVYTVPPGGGHEVFVDFRDKGRDMRMIKTAVLIVGGISFSTDPRTRVVGEIPRSRQAHEINT